MASGVAQTRLWPGVYTRRLKNAKAFSTVSMNDDHYLNLKSVELVRLAPYRKGFFVNYANCAGHDIKAPLLWTEMEQKLFSILIRHQLQTERMNG